MTEDEYKVIQKLQFNITDLKTNYINTYGIPNTWGAEKKSIFCLNCEMMLLTNMELMGIKPHKIAIQEGMFPYIEHIQSDITKRYIHKYGLSMDIDESGAMYDKIDSYIYNFITKGEEMPEEDSV